MNQGIAVAVLLFGVQVIAGQASAQVFKREDSRHFARRGSEIFVYDEIFAHGENRVAIAVKNIENYQFLKTEQNRSPGRLAPGLKIELEAAIRGTSASSASEALEGNLKEEDYRSAYRYINLDESASQHPSPLKESELSKQIKARLAERANALCKLNNKDYLHALVEQDYFGLGNLTIENQDRSIAVTSLMTAPGQSIFLKPFKIAFVTPGASFLGALPPGISEVIRDPEGILPDGKIQIVIIPSFTFKKLGCVRKATEEEKAKLITEGLVEAGRVASPSGSSSRASSRSQSRKSEESIDLRKASDSIKRPSGTGTSTSPRQP